jgi:hypothetical protein
MIVGLSPRCFACVFLQVADSVKDRDAWVDTLTHLVVTIRSLGHQKEYEM